MTGPTIYTIGHGRHAFADFVRDRIFKPRGMSHTSWRDDFTRIVKGRAIAYSEEKDGYHLEMPFENVHGNGGLLTTVGDLLRWNENFTAHTLADERFSAAFTPIARSQRARTSFGLGVRLPPVNGQSALVIAAP